MTGPDRTQRALFRWQLRVHELMDPADGERLGKIIDLIIIGLIGLSVTGVIFETVDSLHQQYRAVFRGIEILTISVFSLEYVLRLWSITVLRRYQHPFWGRLRFALTPLMVIDLLAILPFYLPIVFDANLAVIHYLRYLRLLRLLKLARYLHALRIMGQVIRQKSEELTISLVAVLFLLITASCGMYFIEHDAQPEKFSSIPETMWWGVATLTTVGYGDVYPVTMLGKFLGAGIAMLGIGLFALPAGILASGFSDQLSTSSGETVSCEICGAQIHAGDPPT